MHIRAPKSGFMSVHVSRASVAKNDLLFSFDDMEEKVEVVKAQLALQLVRNSMHRLELANRDGILNKTLALLLEKVTTNRDANKQAALWRKDQFQVGEVTRTTVSQAEALDDAGQRDHAIASRAIDDTRMSLDDLAELLPMQQQYALASLELCQINVTRTRIFAPIDGILTNWQRSDTWIARGDVIGTFEV